MPLFSFTNIPWTSVITTFIQHQSCLLFSRPANHQAILMNWDAKKQQGTESSCVTIVPLQNQLIAHIFKARIVESALNRIWFDQLLTLSLETVFTKSTNKLWRWLLQLHVSPPLCVELEYILAPLLILFTGNSSTSSIDVIPGPIAPILLELRFANWGLRRIFPLNTK